MSRSLASARSLPATRGNPVMQSSTASKMAKARAGCLEDPLFFIAIAVFEEPSPADVAIKSSPPFCMYPAMILEGYHFIGRSVISYIKICNFLHKYLRIAAQRTREQIVFPDELLVLENNPRFSRANILPRSWPWVTKAVPEAPIRKKKDHSKRRSKRPCQLDEIYRDGIRPTRFRTGTTDTTPCRRQRTA